MSKLIGGGAVLSHRAAAQTSNAELIHRNKAVDGNLSSSSSCVELGVGAHPASAHPR